MKIKCRERLLAFLFLSFTQNAFAQSDSAAHTAVKPSFKLGLYYISNLNYFGRTDSLRSSAVFPLAELWFTPQLYINAAPIFVSNKVQSLQYAGSVATLGYRYSSSNQKIGAHVYVVKPFYEAGVELPQSALKAQGAFTITYRNPVLNITGGADVKFSKGADYGITGGIDHVIKHQLGDKTVLVIDPSAYVFAGTQRFTESYYRNTGIPGINQLVTKSTQRFTVLSYELSMPIVLGIGKIQLIALPAYVLPQHLISVPGRSDLSERGQNLFYATAGVKMNF